MSRTVYLHVGTGKSGTTYLQRMLARNRALLKSNGVLYPGTGPSHFMASMDLRDAGFNGYEYPEAEGAWDELVAEVRAWPGNVVISHETLGRMPVALIEKAIGSFPDSDVRVVVTCRDLGRQIPASWQEWIKNRKQETYTHFLDRVLGSWNDGDTSLRNPFWRSQNLIGLTQRWSKVVGPESVRLVTVPAPGADPTVLWGRFLAATDLPDLEYAVEDASSNASIGTAETELLRRLNPLLPSGMTWPQYSVRIKRRFLTRELARHNRSGRLSVPEEYHAVTQAAAAQMIEHLRGSGCTVIGDLEELRPVLPTGSVQPDEVSTDELLDLALELLAGMAARPRPGVSATSGRQAARVLARAVRNRVRRRR